MSFWLPENNSLSFVLKKSLAWIVAINIESTVMQSDDETIKNTQNVLSFRVI